MRHDHLSGVGQRIRQARESRGLTQAELGRRLGVSFQLVQCYESGRKLTLERAAIIAEVLGLKLRWLLVGDEEIVIAIGDCLV